MVELCLMASHGYPHGLGMVFHQEQGFSRLSKGLHHFLHNPNSNPMVNPNSTNLRLQRKEEWNPTSGLLDYNHFVAIGSTSKRPAVIDGQEAHPELLLFGFAIAKQCTKQENILKLLTSGSLEVEDGFLDLSMFSNLVAPQQPITDEQSFASYSTWCFNDPRSQQSLIYPTNEIYLDEPILELVAPTTENAYYPNGQIQYNYDGNEMNDIISVISDIYLSKNTVRSSKPTMLVPYFERRRRARSNTGSSKLAMEKATQIKSHEKVKEKTAQKKKTNPRTGKDRNDYSTSCLHACESLLSIIVNRKQDGKSTILSLKKSAPQLPHLLTQFSASIAGTGIAVVLSVLCRVACSRVPFCASKLLSTGLGLGLVWLSWAVNKLRDTVVSITKSSGKSGDKEEEMMGNLDRNLKDIYFRAAALVAVAVLRLA